MDSNEPMESDPTALAFTVAYLARAKSRVGQNDGQNLIIIDNITVGPNSSTLGPA
jgi:hypothetical protein